jgi:hypothetical protein
MSPLAQIVDGLPVRGRIGVVLMMADLALAWLESSPDLPVAPAAVDLCRRWYDCERFDPIGSRKRMLAKTAASSFVAP